MITAPEPGTAEWWRETPRDGARGTTDAILRLLEQGEVTRAKARELLRYPDELGAYKFISEDLKKPAQFPNPPSAPWDKLDWGPAGDHSCVTRVSPSGEGRPVVAYLADGTKIRVCRAHTTTGPAWLEHVEQDVLTPQERGHPPPPEVPWSGEDYRR